MRSNPFRPQAAPTRDEELPASHHHWMNGLCAAGSQETSRRTSKRRSSVDCVFMMNINSAFTPSCAMDTCKGQGKVCPVDIGDCGNQADLKVKERKWRSSGVAKCRHSQPSYKVSVRQPPLLNLGAWGKQQLRKSFVRCLSCPILSFVLNLNPFLYPDFVFKFNLKLAVTYFESA